MKFKVIKKTGKLEVGDVVESKERGAGSWNVRGPKGNSFGVPDDCLEQIPDVASASSSPVSSPPPVARREPPPPEVARREPPPQEVVRREPPPVVVVARDEPPPVVVVARDEPPPVVVVARDEPPPMVASSSSRPPGDQPPPAEVPPLEPSLRSSLGAALGSSHVTPLDVRGVTLRLFCVPRMAPPDLIKMVKASEPFMLATGDQSLGEAVSSGKSFYYECNTHKQLLLNDLLDVHRGLRAMNTPAADPMDLAEQDCRYLLAMRQARASDGTALDGCHERFVDTCYPPGVDADTYIFVTCKDAGGQGDITNARKQRKTLMETFGARHVFLVMADTARRQAIEAGESPENVWLVSDGPSDERMHIRNWPERQAKVQLIHAAAPLNASLVSVIKAAVFAGGSYQETVLLEYGYSQYAAPAHVRSGSFRDAMGMGPTELGFLVHRELREYRCARWPSGAPDLATLSLEPLTARLLGDDDARDYGRNHRLYTGYSHYNGERFVKLVAHRERALRSTPAGAVPFIDVVCVGNTFRAKGGTWKSRYTTLVGELGGGGGPDLQELGIQFVEIHDFAKASDDGRDATPYVITTTRHEIRNPRPKAELPRSDWHLDDFLTNTTPGVLRAGFANEPVALERAVYEEAGVWLTSERCALSFVDLSDVLCAARDFDRVFGGSLNRSMRASGSSPMTAIKLRRAKTVGDLRREKEAIALAARK